MNVFTNSVAGRSPTYDPAVTDDMDPTLADLRKEIERTQAEHGEREELSDLAAAVDRKIEEPDHEEHHHNLVDRLRESFTAFENEHPDLGAAIRSALNTLSSSGI